MVFLRSQLTGANALRLIFFLSVIGFSGAGFSAQSTAVRSTSSGANPMMNIDHTIQIIQWFGIFICGSWGTSFTIRFETGKEAVINFTVGQANGATR